MANFNFYGYEEIVNLGDNHRGTAILYKENIPLTHINRLPSGRGTAANFGRVRLINIYAPSGSDNRQLRSAFFAEDVTVLFTPPHEVLVLAGDFNCVLRDCDATGRVTSCASLRLLVDGLQLRDAASDRRVVHTFRTSTSASRLDRFYVSVQLVPQVKSYHCDAVAFSDHLAVACHLNLAQEYAPRGASYWKLNTAILKDTAFLPEFTARYAAWVTHKRRFPTIVEWWEKYFKPNVQRFCKAFAANMYREENAFIDFYQKCLIELVQQPTSVENMTSIREVKEQIINRQQEHMQGVLVRSKCNSPIAGERTTMYHLVRLHKRAKKKAIHSLRTPEGTALTDNPSMLAHAADTFSDKFAAPIGPSAAHLYLKSMPSALSAEAASELEVEISEEEIGEALQRSPSKKSPGIDGLPADFYKKVWEVVKADFVQMTQCVLDTKPLGTQTQGVIVLVPKVNNASSLSQFRPLSMLCADYKIIARVVNARLMSVINTLIHPAQVGPGTARDITASLCDIRDAIAHHQHTALPAALLSLDVAAAFDSVSHEYIFCLIEKLGFGPNVLKWVRCLYTGAEARMEVNGYISRAFSVGKSVRQGCPLSMTLFLLVMRPLVERLALCLAASKGCDTSFCVSNYVDDLQVLLTHPKQVGALQKELAQFAGASGLHVNATKSKALLLGEWSPRVPMPYTPVQSTKILGIHFSKSVNELPHLNWPPVVRAASAVLRAAVVRSLCVEERSWYVGTYALSKLWYVAKVVHPMAKHLCGMRAEVSSFLWNGHTFRIPYPVVCLPLQQGGLGLLDAFLRCKALFYSRCCTMAWQCPDTFSSVYQKHLITALPPPRPVPRAVAHFTVYRSVATMVSLDTEGIDGPLLTSQAYQKLRQHYLPPRIRVEEKLPSTEWSRVWEVVQARLLPVKVRDVWFRAVHDIMPTNERLAQHLGKSTDRCDHCGKWDTALHRFTTCQSVPEIWHWLRTTIAKVAQVPGGSVHQDFIVRPDTLIKHKKRRKTVAWIVGHTLHAIANQEGLKLPALLQQLHTQRDKFLQTRSSYSKRQVGKHLIRAFTITI